MKSEISYLLQDSTLLRRDGDAVQVLVVGVGKEAVHRSLNRWLKARGAGSTSNRPDRLLLLGFAGAVDPALGCGDLILAGRYCLHQGTPDELGPEEVGKDFFEADSSMLEQAAAAAGAPGLAWRQVESLTVGRPVRSGEEKAAIHRRRPVGPLNLGAINMEDYWVAEFAARAEIPFLAVRAVIDSAGQTIPSYAMGLQEGRWSALASAAARPWQLPNLVRLASNRRLAQRSLRRFVLAFLQNPDGLDKEENRLTVSIG